MALTFLLEGCCRLGADEAPSTSTSTSSGASAAAQADASAPSTATSVADPSMPKAPPGQPTSENAAASNRGPIVDASGREIVGAAHILIAYKGAELAPKTITRSKEEARKRAEEVLAKVRANQGSFGALANQYSDDPSKVTGGAIGNFERNAMPSAFSEAAFGLASGEISNIVETPRGFHIIQRTR